MIKLRAYQVADYIDIKLLKLKYVGKLLSYSSSDLFFENEDNTFLYILSYGVVVMANYDELKATQSLEYIQTFTKKAASIAIDEYFEVHENAAEDRFEHNKIHISKTDNDTLKIIMLNVGQSVALDYYQKLTNEMLEETYKYTSQLEEKGKLSIKNKTLLKFIGRTLNIKNSVIDDLYVIGQPEVTWNDERLSTIDKGLRNTFDIKVRFQDIDYSLQIVKENLELFKDLVHHNKSSLLEIIIIALILVEVFNLFAEKFF